ncbi:MAG: class II fructose-bisphosphate aldolase [Desulfobacterales bacterium]|jgi:ketose-bisphosphate aldolase
MLIENLKELLDKALRQKYAIPAFNVWTFQDAITFVKASNASRSPLILQASDTCIAHNGLVFTWQLISNAIKEAKVPVVIHLDHAKDLELINAALELGFTSIMFDGSDLSLEENIAKTILAKKIADRFGASLEAEIGHVKKHATEIDTATIPEEAVRFVRETGVDALAVSVGTRHGMQKGASTLNFDLLKQLDSELSLPLVLHGSSGVSDEDLLVVAKSGICKVNFATRLRRIFIKEAGRIAPHFQDNDHIRFMMQVYQSVLQEAKFIQHQLGSANMI